MATALRASCPSCKLQVTVSEAPSDGDIATVVCTGCGKKFGLRFPKSDAAPKPKVTKRAAPVPQEDPFANLTGALPDASSTNVNWEDYQVRRKPLIAGKPLAIAIGVTAAIACLIAIGVFVSQKAADIDMNAIGDSLFKGPEDTIDKIHAEWTRYNNEQRSMIASISHSSHCDELMFPMERLEEKHLNLVVRGALLEQGAVPKFDVKDLPPAPSMQPTEGKAFRSIEAFLTTEFRAAEKKLNLASNAVLCYLHTAAKPIEIADNEAAKGSLNKIFIKRALCRALAEAHRGAEESKTAVTIYELTEELKKLDQSASAASQELQFAEFTATQMQAVLAARFTKNPESEIAKALTAFDQAY
ncbi:MAG: hypothetical protein SFV81_20545 [Pirellulaceae bacterium]|nr:hypothetical protein [Pirellulaceae bacterium]